MVSETYKPSQHGGTKKDGTEDKRFVDPTHSQFIASYSLSLPTNTS